MGNLHGLDRPPLLRLAIYLWVQALARLDRVSPYQETMSGYW
jgi:hypothetical protein